MTLIQSYVNNVREAKGIVHKARVAGLRSYLKTLDDISFREQVVLMDDEKDLKILWESGLTKSQQDFVMRRAEELQRRRS